MQREDLSKRLIKTEYANAYLNSYLLRTLPLAPYAIFFLSLFMPTQKMWIGSHHAMLKSPENGG